MRAVERRDASVGLTIFEAFVNDAQRSLLSGVGEPFFAGTNTGKDQREYELFKELFRQRQGNDEPWGLLSWKFNAKSRATVAEFSRFARQQFERGADCVFINPLIGFEALFASVWEPWAAGEEDNKKLFDLLIELTAGQVSAYMPRNVFCFCNYFVARPAFWSAYFAYVDDVIERLGERTRQQADLDVIYQADVGYRGVPGLTRRVFIIERLFSTFLSKASGAKIVPYVYGRAVYSLKFGDRVGNLVWNLSALKNEAIAAGDESALRDWQRLRLKLMNSSLGTAVLNLDDPDNDFYAPEFQALMKSPAAF